MVPAWILMTWLAMAAGAPAGTQPAPRAVPAPTGHTAYTQDTPPPTPYDLQLQQAPLGVAPRTQGLLWYAGRVFLALVAVLALIYATIKGLLPRYFKKWTVLGGRELEVVERLGLDGRNAVVLLRLASGERLLVGTGEHGVQYLTKLDGPPAADFREALTATAAHGGHTQEAPHAAAH
ncbi:MAG: hypothetical protein EOO40_01485 [Deltaproteobacteria bacterium]|nr:MAG: hypothetical protein EOO40_01485 [Deltaproteobacteria bacterium]